jgi:hypothetical protein
MTTFRADTDVMRSGAQQLGTAASDIGQVGTQVAGLAGQVDHGKYQGQLASKVNGILSGVAGQAGSLQSRLTNSGSQLQSKASAIDAAVQAAGGASAALTLADYEALASAPMRLLIDQLPSLNWQEVIALLVLAGFSPALAAGLLGVLLVLPKSQNPGDVQQNGRSTGSSSNHYRTTGQLNFRSGPGIVSTVITTLGVGAILVATGQTVQIDGHTWLEVTAPNGQRGWVASEYLQPVTSIASPSLAQDNNAQGRQALLQTKPVGDEQVLGLNRVANDKGDIETFGGKPIRTVADQIAAYGCLMTGFTMLLQDKGVNVSVTDLYRANYELATGRRFADDAKDGKIVMPDLYARPEMVQRAAAGYQLQDSQLFGKTPADIRQSLQSNLSVNGSVIVHVQSAGDPKDGHWIVVDGVNKDGTFSVRDPMSGQVQRASIGGEPANYQFASDAAIRYVSRVPSGTAK